MPISIIYFAFSSCKRYPIVMFLPLMRISPLPSSSGSTILVEQPVKVGPTLPNLEKEGYVEQSIYLVYK